MYNTGLRLARYLKSTGRLQQIRMPERDYYENRLQAFIRVNYRY